MKTKDVETFWSERIGEDVDIIPRGLISNPDDVALYIGGTFMIAYKDLSEIEDYLAIHFPEEQNA